MTMRPVCISVLLLVFVITLAARAKADPQDVTVDGVPLTTIIAHLKGDDQALGMAALELLEGAGPEAAAAAPTLVRILRADDPAIRARVLAILCRIAGGSATAAGLADLAANDPDSLMRSSAQRALTELAVTGPAELYIEPAAVAEPAVPPAEPGVTAFLQPLREHHTKLVAVEDRIGRLATRKPQDDAAAVQWLADLKGAGGELLREGEAFRSTLSQFINSRTRRGLTEEMRLISECIATTDNAGADIRSRTGFDANAYAAQRNLRQQQAGMRDTAVAILAEVVDDRLEAEGLLALLATEGIAAVKTEVMARLRTTAQAEVDRLTERELGIAFHDKQSFSSALRWKLRSILRGKVHELVFKVTSNEIIVELLSRPIIKWLETDLWPKLKEALRNKDDLDSRTERSIASLAQARVRLWALPPNATLDRVEATRQSAAGTLMATHYLIGDLERGQRTDLHAKLKAAAKDLARAIDRSADRFLLTRLQELEALRPQAEVYRALLAMLEVMVGQIGTPAQIAQAQTATPPAEGTPASGAAGFTSWLRPSNDPEFARRVAQGMGARDRGERRQEPVDRIAGTYDGRREGGATNEFVVTVTGDPAFGLGWQMATPTGDVVSAGTLSDSGQVVEGARLFSGYFRPPGREDNGWARIRVANRNGAWKAEFLDIWNDGRPEGPQGGQHFRLTRRQ